MTRARTLLLAALVVLPIVHGCAARGAAFRKVEQIPADRALVYIYRPNSIVGGAIRYYVSVDERRIVYLIRGGYFPFLATPGETQFSAQTEGRVTATGDLIAGQTYYLRGGINPGIGIGRPSLEFVSAEVGAADIGTCVLLPPAEQSD